MSLIKHLTEQLCPTCGAVPCAEEVTGTHVNGQQFENRKFQCGRRIRWVPNFERAEVVDVCPKDKDKMAQEIRRKTIVVGLVKKALELKMTKEELQRLTQFLTYSQW